MSERPLYASDIVEKLRKIASAGSLAVLSDEHLTDLLKIIQVLESKKGAMSRHVMAEMGFKECLEDHPEHGWTHWMASKGLGGVFYAPVKDTEFVERIYAEGKKVGVQSAKAEIRKALGIS